MAVSSPGRPLGFGPERVRGCPRSHSPGKQRPAAAAAGSASLCAGHGLPGGSPRSPGSSRGLGEHRPGWTGAGRAAEGRRRPSRSRSRSHRRVLRARRLRPASLEFGSGGGGRGCALLKGTRCSWAGTGLEPPDAGRARDQAQPWAEAGPGSQATLPGRRSHPQTGSLLPPWSPGKGFGRF